MNQKPVFLCSCLLMCSVLAMGGGSLNGLSQLGGNTDVFQLSNGLKILFQFNDSSEITVCQIFIQGGKKAEPHGKEGLSYMTTRLTLEFPDRSTFQKMMEQATELNISGRMDYSQICIACLSDFFEETIALTSQILSKPLFSSIRIDSIKKMMIQVKEIEEDDPLVLAHQTVLDNYFSDTPYSYSVYGTETSLKAIRKRDVDKFYEDHFRADQMFLVVSSDLSPTKIQEILEAHFGGISPLSVKESIVPVAIRLPDERKHSIEKDTEQTLVMSAFPLPPMSPRNLILSYFLYYHIGHGANSELWPLRMEERLAYTVSTRLALFAEGGVLEAYLETDNEKQDVAASAMLEILTDFYEKGLTEEELASAKSYYKGAFLREIESKEGRTQKLGDFEALGLGIEFLDRIFQEIEATTLDELNSFIKTNLDPKKRLDVRVGPSGITTASR